MSDSELGTRYPEAEGSPGLALWRVTNQWQRAMRDALAPHGVTHVQYVLLASLVWLQQQDRAGVVSQAKLAEFAATDKMMTSQVVRALQAKGLLDRAPHPHDARANALHVTPAGIEIAHTATADVEREDTKFFAPLADPARFLGDLIRLRGLTTG